MSLQSLQHLTLEPIYPAIDPASPWPGWQFWAFGAIATVGATLLIFVLSGFRKRVIGPWVHRRRRKHTLKEIRRSIASAMPAEDPEPFLNSWKTLIAWCSASPELQSTRLHPDISPEDLAFLDGFKVDEKIALSQLLPLLEAFRFSRAWQREESKAAALTHILPLVDSLGKRLHQNEIR